MLYSMQFSWRFALFFLLVSLMGCSPSLYIKESFRQPAHPPVQVFKKPSLRVIIALNRGETIEITDIVKKEKVTPQKVLLTRLLGRYVLTAVGFRHIWIIQPKGRNSATYFAVEAPQKKPFEAPEFSHSEFSNCVILKVAHDPKEWHIHPSGAIARSCSDVEK